MPAYQRTLVVVKPDGVRRKLVSRIIGRYEEAGYEVIGLKMMKATPEIMIKHYKEDIDYFRSIGKKSQEAGIHVTDQVEFGREVVRNLREYMMSGQVVPMVLEGIDAVAGVRAVTGKTNPIDAAPGTIRHDFGDDDFVTAQREGRTTRNIVHASGTLEEAMYEIPIWFKEDEIYGLRN